MDKYIHLSKIKLEAQFICFYIFWLCKKNVQNFTIVLSKQTRAHTLKTSPYPHLREHSPCTLAVRGTTFPSTARSPYPALKCTSTPRNQHLVHPHQGSSPLVPTLQETALYQIVPCLPLSFPDGTQGVTTPLKPHHNEASEIIAKTRANTFDFFGS